MHPWRLLDSRMPFRVLKEAVKSAGQHLGLKNHLAKWWDRESSYTLMT